MTSAAARSCSATTTPKMQFAAASAIYEAETEPIITWYLERDMLVTIDGTGDPDDVTQRLIRAIDRRRSRNSIVAKSTS